MKKIILILLLITTSCNIDNEQRIHAEKDIALEFTEPSKNALKGLNELFLNSELIKNSSQDLINSLDFKNPISHHLDGNEILIVNQRNTNTHVNYSLSFIIDQSGFKNFLIVKTEQISKTLFKANYINLNNGKELFEIIFDLKKEKLTSYSKSPQNINSKNDPDYDCDSTWGENTASCVNNVYTGNGWTSVWASVQTAFIPQTAIAIAAACAYDAYGPSNGNGCYTNLNGGNGGLEQYLTPCGQFGEESDPCS